MGSGSGPAGIHSGGGSVGLGPWIPAPRKSRPPETPEAWRRRRALGGLRGGSGRAGNPVLGTTLNCLRTPPETPEKWRRRRVSGGPRGGPGRPGHDVKLPPDPRLPRGIRHRPGHDAKLPPDPRLPRGILRRRTPMGARGVVVRTPQDRRPRCSRWDDSSGERDEDCPRGLPTLASVAP